MFRKLCILTMLAISFGFTTASAGMILDGDDPRLVSLDENLIERGKKGQQGKGRKQSFD